MIVRCDSQYFFQRGLAFERLVNASHAQSFHSFSNSLVLDHRRRCPLHNEAANGFGYRQCFNNRLPSEITATLAAITTAPADGRVAEIRRVAIALAASAGALGSGVIVRTA